MKQNLKIALIGSTGKSGKYLLKELLNQGFSVKILLRNPESLPIKNTLIEIVQGDVRDFQTVQTLLEGCQAVISTLGQPKGEASVFSQATQNIIQAMNCWNIKRYILITGLNVDTSYDKKSPKTQGATDWMKENYPETTYDKQKEYTLLQESNLDWTLVRLPFIQQTALKSEITVSLEDCLGDQISTASLAHFLIRQLGDTSYVKQAPFIADC